MYSAMDQVIQELSLTMRFWVKRLATFVVLVLVQGLVFNHIHLFNCATPLLWALL